MGSSLASRTVLRLQVVNSWCWSSLYQEEKFLCVPGIGTLASWLLEVGVKQCCSLGNQG